MLIDAESSYKFAVRSKRVRAMAQVTTSTAYVDVEGDYGSFEGVEVTCDRCGHAEQSGGTHDGSRTRCAYLLRENCPRGEKNFYLT